MIFNDIQWLFSRTGLRPFSVSTRIIKWYSMTFLYNGASPLLNNRYMNNWLCHLCQMLPQFFKRIYRNLFSEELFKESLEFGKNFFYIKVPREINFYKFFLKSGAIFDTSDTELFYETYVLFNDIQWLFSRTGLRPLSISTRIIQWYSMIFNDFSLERGFAPSQ